MKKSVSRSFLKVLSVIAAAAAILTLTGCVEEPASTSSANINISISNSNNNSNSTSTAPSSSASSPASSSASSKTEQEATSTSQNPELPASSSSEASSPASSTPASSEVKTNKGDTPANPAKLNESVEIDGIEFGYADISEMPIDENNNILIVGIMVGNNSTQEKLVWEKTAEELYAILPSDPETQEAAQTSATLNAIFAPSSTGFTARIGSTTLPTACYVDKENGTASIAPGEEGMVCLCIQEPTTWNTIQLQISVNNTSRYFEIAKGNIR